MSYDAINYALTREVYPRYDLYHIVGGRVDVVAHSMGGLAVRNYAGPSEYLQNVRSRHTGAFHTLITLDTPEEGSGVADVVYEQAGKHFSPLSEALPQLLWMAKCNIPDTLQVCMDRLGMEVANQGAPADSGAMYSLRPSIVANPQTGGYTIPAVPPNATWIAVAGSFPDSTTDPSLVEPYPRSLLRAVVTNLISAIYPYWQNPPNLDNALGFGFNNDVVVSYGSEVQAGSTFTAPEAIYPINYMQHTSTPVLGSIVVYVEEFTGTYPTYLDTDVTHDSEVNGYILYSLENGK